MAKKYRAGIIGATGFTGSELVRILLGHPEVQIEVITSESRQGDVFSDVHPFYYQIADTKLDSVDNIDNYDLDIAFLALPHGVSMAFAEKFEDKSFRIIDLSGDYRLSGPEVYESWYQKRHTHVRGFDHAVYGLPELFREDIPKARIIANPGCYPTSAILGAAPLVAHQLIDDSVIIIDSKSGVTGAGVKSKPLNHYSNVNENFKAYGISTHRHSIEIEEKLSGVRSSNVRIQFTPHLLPVDRGILTTIYARANRKLADGEIAQMFREHYAQEPFIRVMDNSPAIKHVRGTNLCDIFATYDQRTGNIIIVSVIDNLVKGAAGQAVQNMNLLLGMDETTGLHLVPLNP